MRSISKKAKHFKKAYQLEWYLSNQKEAFIKLLFESLGFEIKPIGLGVMSDKRERDSGSLPDFAVYHKGEVLCYIEVTGDNFYRDGEEKYITYAKINKFKKLNAPVFFIYLGLRKGKLVEAKYCSLRAALKYAENKNYWRFIKTKWGTEEHFVYIPEEEWKPLSDLVHSVKFYLSSVSLPKIPEYYENHFENSQTEAEFSPKEKIRGDSSG